MAQAELRRSGYESLVAAGIVLTGGASKMEGVVELAEEVFHLPVRVGLPQHVTGLSDVVSNPIHAAGVGLLLYGSRQDVVRTPIPAPVSAVSNAWERVTHWIKGEF
jgi:cell division protein FtsA